MLKWFANIFLLFQYKLDEKKWACLLGVFVRIRGVAGGDSIDDLTLLRSDSSEINFLKNPKHIYRYIAIREPLNDSELCIAKSKDYPFPVYVNAQKFLYKLHGIVTNIPIPENNEEKVENRGAAGEFNSEGMWGESVIHWHRERCGRSEQAHSIIKSDFGGGKMPSGKFGVNATWWWISIIAMNLQKLMTLAMDEKALYALMKIRERMVNLFLYDSG